MSLPRFYVSPLLDSGELPDDQAHHARDVLRLDHGQSVILFDGCGHYAPANISFEKKHIFYRLTGPITVEAPPAYSLTIATAIPKADRAHQLLEQISQLGAAGLLWLDCRYSVVHPIADAKKWRSGVAWRLNRPNNADDRASWQSKFRELPGSFWKARRRER